MCLTPYKILVTTLTKRMAEDCAEQCAAVGHIQNNLRVRSAVDSGANPTGSATDQFGDKPKTTDV